jgi:hypothetical protein
MRRRAIITMVLLRTSPLSCGEGSGERLEKERGRGRGWRRRVAGGEVALKK